MAGVLAVALQPDSACAKLHKSYSLLVNLIEKSDATTKADWVESASQRD